MPDNNNERGGGAGSAVLIALAGQTALLTGSLFYFGYVRTQYSFGYFGIDVSLLNFSATDYILRSGPSIFVPLVTFALLYTYFWCVLRLYTHMRDLPQSQRRRWCLLGVLLIIFITTALAATIAVRPLMSQVTLLLIAVSSVTSMLGLTLIRRPPSDALARNLIAPVLALSAASFFLANSLQAEHSGIAAARAVEDGTAPRPIVELYSASPLAISNVDGVSTQKLIEADGKYKYRIRGLKLLIVSGGQYFLIRSRPSQSPGDIIIVPSGPDVRLSVGTS